MGALSAETKSEYWRVAVDAPLRDLLTYSAPSELVGQFSAGMRVRVPLGRREVAGVLIEKCDEPAEFAVKSILNPDMEYPVLEKTSLKWLDWVAKYYMHPPGQVYSLSYPSLKKQIKERKSSRPKVIPTETDIDARPKLTHEQICVVDKVLSLRGFQTHLIFGVTGSGKTEIYLQILEDVLKKGQTGLFLLPEISLTPQMIQRFSARFPGQVGVLHSQLTDRERTNQWWEIVDNKKKILLGARSALFCPIPNLGVVIVDEEHEPSFKQEEKLKYHGRDAAIMLAKIKNCPVLLGSATPSLESWWNAQNNKYHLHTLSKRVQDRAMPNIQVIDLRQDESEKKQVPKTSDSLPRWMSPELYELLLKTYEEKKQSALFLNRRGLAPLVLCESCGYVHECPNCDISLTLHHREHLICHYCDYHENYKIECPSCKEGEMKPVGLGTEQIEVDLQRLFPESRVARADRDEIQNRHDLEELIFKMEKGEIDFLVGTQMIAKGLDFPKLKSVGLVLADIGFNIPDFRSTERSFQLMTQVSGRAGRHILENEEPGQVIVQTYNPEHPSLVYAQKHNYVSFADQELQNRKELGYPPFGRLAGVRLQGASISELKETCFSLAKRAEQLKQLNQKTFFDVEVLGPSESPLAKLRNQFRFQMLIKAKEASSLHHFCLQLLSDESWISKKVKITLDIDPLHLL